MAAASILVSEVEPDVRRLFTTIITRLGHDAVVLDADVVVPPRADILLVDPIARESAEHVRLVRAFYPDLPVILLNPLPGVSFVSGRGPVFSLPKPFTPEQLAAMLERALTHAPSPV